VDTAILNVSIWSDSIRIHFIQLLDLRNIGNICMAAIIVFLFHLKAEIY